MAEQQEEHAREVGRGEEDERHDEGNGTIREQDEEEQDDGEDQHEGHEEELDGEAAGDVHDDEEEAAAPSRPARPNAAAQEPLPRSRLGGGAGGLRPRGGMSLQQQMVLNKYGGMQPKKVATKAQERTYFDSADWAIAKEKGEKETTSEVEHLSPKLQPSPPKRPGRRPSFTEADQSRPAVQE
eukprot:jgi/Chlat1/3103/Chrsp21S03335